MTTPDRFTLETQVIERLTEQEHDTWIVLSDTLRRTMLLAGGFMDVEVVVKNVREINLLARR